MTNIAQVTMEDVLTLWESLDESRHFGTVDRVQRCVERPELVVIGESNGCETFAVLNVTERRFVPEEEFPSWNLDDDSGLHWRDVPAATPHAPVER